MNHEMTINGLTKQSARQLGQAYFALAESLDLIDDLTVSKAASSHAFAKLSMEAAGLRCANAGLKRYNARLEEENQNFRKAEESRKTTEESIKCAFGLPRDSPFDETQHFAPVYAKGDTVSIGNNDYIVEDVTDITAVLSTPLVIADPGINDTPRPEHDNHSPNGVREMGKRAAEKVAKDFGETLAASMESPSV